MNDRTMEKYGALGSIWFVILAVIGSLLAIIPAARSDSAADIAQDYLDNDSSIQVGVFLTTLGVVGLVWWFGSLWRAMNRIDDSSRLATIALAGFVFSAAMAMAGFSVHAGTAAGIESLGEGSAGLYQIASVFLSASGIGDVVFVGAVTALAFRSGFLPKLVARWGLVVVLAALISSIGIATDGEFIEFFGFISFITWSLWLIAVGVHLFRNAPTDV